MPTEPPHLSRRSFLSAAAAGIVSSPIWAKSTTAPVSESQLLSDIEHRTFCFYWERVNHSNGLMADRWSTPAACSITGTGFALIAWPIGVERGWITRNQARDITLRTLRFFEQLPQGEQRSGTAGYRGFYYHLIDMETGLRLPNWELSTIDTCWLQMGMAFAQGWFDQEDEKGRRSVHSRSVCWIAPNGIGCRPIARAAKPSRWAGTRRAALLIEIGMAITRAWRSISSRSAHGLTRLRRAPSRHGLRPSQNIGAEKVRTVTSPLRRTLRINMGPCGLTIAASMMRPRARPGLIISRIPAAPRMRSATMPLPTPWVGIVIPRTSGASAPVMDQVI